MLEQHTSGQRVEGRFRIGGCDKVINIAKRAVIEIS